MTDDAVNWSTAILNSAQGHIETRRRANLDQLILVQGRHQGLIEALAMLRERHAQATKADPKSPGDAPLPDEGIGLAVACRQVHDLVVAAHAEVLTQAGSVRENEALIAALLAKADEAKPVLLVESSA